MVWVPDPDFDPDNHLRRVALPAPGYDAELSRHATCPVVIVPA